MSEPLDDDAMAEVLDRYGATLARLETAAGYDHATRIGQHTGRARRAGATLGPAASGSSAAAKRSSSPRRRC